MCQKYEEHAPNFPVLPDMTKIGLNSETDGKLSY